MYELQEQSPQALLGYTEISTPTCEGGVSLLPCLRLPILFVLTEGKLCETEGSWFFTRQGIFPVTHP